jgi:hypothetical protein
MLITSIANTHAAMVTAENPKYANISFGCKEQISNDIKRRSFGYGFAAGIMQQALLFGVDVRIIPVGCIVLPISVALAACKITESHTVFKALDHMHTEAAHLIFEHANNQLELELRRHETEAEKNRRKTDFIRQYIEWRACTGKLPPAAASAVRAHNQFLEETTRAYYFASGYITATTILGISFGTARIV